MKNYSVIGKWKELDGSEEWDVIHKGPLSYEEALKIASDASESWSKNVYREYKNVWHQEIPVECSTLEKMLEDESLKSSW